MIGVAIHGAAGRMGLRLMALACESEKLYLAGALERPGHADLGRPVTDLYGLHGCNGVLLSDGLSASNQPASSSLASGESEVSGDSGDSGGIDVVIDFSAPVGMGRILNECVASKTPLVIGTTGLTNDDHRAIDEAAGKIAVLQAPNMSLGVNLLLRLVGEAAKVLGDDYDVEIVESHHRFKKDAPSGTALGLTEAICQATGKNLADDVDYGYHGKEAARTRGRIGVQSLRMGDVVGQHTVCYGGIGERLELTHIATDRDVFAHGALHAAEWLTGQPPDRYTMADVLGG